MVSISVVIADEGDKIMEVGVVIGRFQVDNLHAGHRYIISNALQNHRKVIVFLGIPQIGGTRHDPLDYPTRERMIRAEFPDVFVLPLKDCQADEMWSAQVDDLIQRVVPNVKKAVLYGGRESFIPHYQGRHTAVEIDSEIGYNSATEERKEIGKVVRSSADFRAGAIYAQQNSFPHVRACVDIALIKDTDGKGNPEPIQILLGRKPSEIKWRLPGGMADPGEPFHHSACRELAEETGMFIERDLFQYVTSAAVEDWRFKKIEEIALTTTLFIVKHQWGAPKAGDDLGEVKWFSLKDASNVISDTHKHLLEIITERLNNEQ